MNPIATARLAVDGMTCSSCERHVRDALEGVAGVRSASVDAVEGVAVIEHDPSTSTLADLVQAVERAGYRAQVRQEATAPSRPRKMCQCCAGRP